MSVPIIACPSCKSLVLPDTAQCPNCGHVFDETRASEPVPQSVPESSEDEVPCPGCNELVRKGLVRCWNCGTFMKQEIAESYRKMQISPQPVIYSDVDDATSDATAFRGPLSGSGRLVETAPPTTTTTDDADDFQVSSPMDDEGLEDDGDFDIGTAKPPTRPNEIVASAPSYALRVEPEAAKPAERASGASAAASASAKETDPKSDFANEFENRFGGDDPIAEAGEGLLRVALAEEAETSGRRRAQKLGEGGSRAGFRVYCPNGHCIEVQERHRGLTGRCPRCREMYYVPAGSWDEERAQRDDEAQKAAAITAAVKEQAAGDQPVEISAGEYTRWMLDSHFHDLDLTKLKLRPASLLKDFQDADAGFAPDGMLLVLLTKKGGLFGGGEKKALTIRESVLDHLSKGKARDDLPCAAHYFFAAAAMTQIRVVQPIVSDEQSMFAGVPVFGEGRIAVRLPKRDEAANPQFLSYALSEFRRLSKILEEFYGVQRFGTESGIPLEDVYTERFCHFSDQPLRILENLEFYKNDPGFRLKIIGRKCVGCGLVVSEESREKEKIGGPGAKKIAKAKCPKCQKLFGDLALYGFDAPAAAPADAATAK